MVRARGSYPRSPGFKSLHRHQFSGGRRVGASRQPAGPPPASQAPTPSPVREPVVRPCSLSPSAFGAPSGATAPAAGRRGWSSALSGGADSVALAVAAARAGDRRRLRRWPASPTSIIGCAGRPPTRTRRSAARWRPASRCPSTSRRVDVRALARDAPHVDRGRRPRGAVRVLRPRGRPARRRPRRRRPHASTIRPRRSCCACFAARDRAVWPASTRARAA